LIGIFVINVSGQPVGLIFNGESTQEETSVNNLQSTLCNITEEQRPRLYGGGRLMSNGIKVIQLYRDDYMFGDLNIFRFYILVLMFVISIIFLIVSPSVISLCMRMQGSKPKGTANCRYNLWQLDALKCEYYTPLHNSGTCPSDCCESYGNDAV
jgi:hypothetical protein